MTEEAGKAIDQLHAGVLFSQSFLPSAFEGCMDACQVHNEYLLFVLDFMLYVWFAKDAMFEEPVALMYNVYTATLVSPSCDDFFVVNSIGDLLIVRFHSQAIFSDPAALHPAEQSSATATATAAAATTSVGEEQTFGTHEKPVVEVMEILHEISLCDYNVEITNCRLHYDPHYQLLMITSEMSALVTVLSFLHANATWAYKGSFTVDLSADLPSIQLASFWGLADEPFLVLSGHGSHLFFQALDFTATVDSELSLKRSRHPTWITALSRPLPPGRRSAPPGDCWAATGDTSGYLCFWQRVVYSLPVQRVDDHGRDVGPPRFERQTGWKLVCAERDLLAGQAVTVIATDSQHAWIGDRAGRVTCVHFSIQTKRCYVVHQLHLFPPAVSVSQVAVWPLTPQVARVRALSVDWRECVECVTSKTVSRLRRNWPLPHHHLLDAVHCEADPMAPLVASDPSLTTSRTLHPTASQCRGFHGLPVSVVHVCVVLAHAQLVAVAGETASSLHLYDLHTNALLQSIVLPFLSCTRLSGYDGPFAQTSSALLAAGNEAGRVVVYQLVLRLPGEAREDPDGGGGGGDGSADLLSLRSCSTDSLASSAEASSSAVGEETAAALAADTVRPGPPLGVAGEPPGVFDLLDPSSPSKGPLEEGSGGSAQGPAPSASPAALPRPPRSATDVFGLQVEARWIHDLQTDLHAVSDLFFSNTGESLLVVAHRRHFSLYTDVCTSSAVLPHLQRLERRASQASLSLEAVATSLSVVHPLPEDGVGEDRAAGAHRTQRLLVAVQIGGQVGLLDALSLSFLSHFSLDLPRGLDGDGEACGPRSVLLWDYSGTTPQESRAVRSEAGGEEDGETRTDTVSEGMTADRPRLPPRSSPAGERGLLGLCVHDLCTWMAVSDRWGFQLLAELRVQVQRLLEGRGVSRLSTLLWSMAGFSDDQSPILVAWSPDFVLLLRVQLNRERGPLIMRVKLLSLRASLTPQAWHGRVVYAQALPLLPKVRFHQVFIALSSGFSFIVNL